MSPAELERHLLDTIPLARAMQFRLSGHGPGRVHVRAPLAPNCNDKGCAFGGSLSSLMTLAGWACTVLELGRHGGSAEVYVQDSQIRYLAPVWEDIEIHAWLQPADQGAEFMTAYTTRGRARLTVRAECRLRDGSTATILDARYAALDPARRDQRQTNPRAVA